MAMARASHLVLATEHLPQQVLETKVLGTLAGFKEPRGLTPTVSLVTLTL